MRPIFGLNSRIQAIVLRIPGMMKGISAITMKSFLNGVLVRSLTQARNVPITNDKRQVPSAYFIEFQNSR